MGPGHVGLVECGIDLPGRAGGPHRGQWAAGDDEVPGPVGQADHRVQLLRDLDQLSVPDELEVSTLAGGDPGAPRIQQLDEVGGLVGGLGDPPAPACSTPGNSASMASVEVTGDAGDHLRKLDRFGDVMDEVDQYGQVQQQQGLGHGDREVGDEVPPGKFGNGTQTQHRVDERGRRTRRA